MIPFARPDITSAEIKAVNDVLRSGWLTSGPQNQGFEKDFSQSVHASYAIAVNSCTSALHLALVCHGLGNKDAVILPSITFIASAEAIMYTGAMPLALDVDPVSYLLTPEILESFIKEKCKIIKNQVIHRPSSRVIKAVMPVHLAGRPCDLFGIYSVIKKYKIPIIDDCAHAVGAGINSYPIGSDVLPGKISCFSFYATKNITTGEGGMMTFKDKSILSKIKYLRLHGIKGQTYGRQRWKYDVVMQGYKYNLTDFSAALGRIQLRRHPQMLKKRKKISESYQRNFKDLHGVTLDPGTSFESGYHLYTIHLGNKKRRDKFVEKMFASQIAVSLHFIPLYRHSFWKKKFANQIGEFPGAEFSYKGMVSLPLFSALKKNEILRIIDTVKKIIRHLDD